MNKDIVDTLKNNSIKDLEDPFNCTTPELANNNWHELNRVCRTYMHAYYPYIFDYPPELRAISLRDLIHQKTGIYFPIVLVV